MINCACLLVASLWVYARHDRCLCSLLLSLLCVVCRPPLSCRESPTRRRFRPDPSKRLPSTDPQSSCAARGEYTDHAPIKRLCDWLRCACLLVEASPRTFRPLNANQFRIPTLAAFFSPSVLPAPRFQHASSSSRLLDPSRACGAANLTKRSAWLLIPRGYLEILTTLHSTAPLLDATTAISPAFLHIHPSTAFTLLRRSYLINSFGICGRRYTRWTVE